MKSIFIFLLFTLLTKCKSVILPLDYAGEVPPTETPQIFHPGVISIKGRFEHGLSFSPDQNELVFGVLKKDFTGEIHYSYKENKIWSNPTLFTPLANKSAFLPYFIPKGGAILYAQSNSKTGANDIWMANKTNESWDNAILKKLSFNSTSREANACMTNNGNIYFSSNRNCAGIENCYTADLFVARPTNQSFQKAHTINSLSSPNDEESVFVSPREDYIMFCRYTDNKTWMDLYISYQNANKGWTLPSLVDTTINSKDWDRRPFVTNDNKYLFFTRLQMNEKGLQESDIYWSNTEKLFKPFVYNPISALTIKAGEDFEISLPLDYFKDIDSEDLEIRLLENAPQWLQFNPQKMKLYGKATTTGTYQLTFTATDKANNTTEDIINLLVID